MREGRAAVILQRTQHWIDVNLIAGASEDTTPIVAGKVISKRHDRATVVENRSANRVSSIQDGIADLCRSAIIDSPPREEPQVVAEGAIGHDEVTTVQDAAGPDGRVCTERAIGHGKVPTVIDTTATEASTVIADGTVS